MLANSDLLEALDGVEVLSRRATLFRAVDLQTLYGPTRSPPHPKPRPLWSLGAPAHGARFTPRHGPPGLYLAETPETAYAEGAQIQAIVLRISPETVGPIPPKVLFTAEMFVEKALDLTTRATLEALGTSEAELTAPWRLSGLRVELPPTQRLGQAVFDHGGFQAMRYPSVQAPGSACWLVLVDRLVGPSFIEVHAPHHNLRQRLP